MGALKIGLVAPVKPFHPYLVDDLAPLLDLHDLRISPWLWFSEHRRLVQTGGQTFCSRGKSQTLESPVRQDVFTGAGVSIKGGSGRTLT